MIYMVNISRSRSKIIIYIPRGFRRIKYYVVSPDGKVIDILSPAPKPRMYQFHSGEFRALVQVNDEIIEYGLYQSKKLTREELIAKYPNIALLEGIR